MQVETLQEPAQVAFAAIGARTSENLHHHRLRDGDRAVGGDEFGAA